MQNFDEVKDLFRQVIAHSQHIPDPQVDDLFEQWKHAKRNFLQSFGGKMIYEFPEPISFDLGESERKARVDTFIEMLEYKWDNWELSRFVEDMRDGFFNNLTTHDFSLSPDKQIKKGTKLVKAFKYFEKDSKALTDIQNYASRIIQEDKVEGTLCLSVHPLDFLSVSENTHNWRSCHALDGEYRVGNLCYMTDESTFICYLKSNKDEILPNFPFAWNSKKWRVLLYLSDDKNMIFAGRQYPFSSDVGLNFILTDLIPCSGLMGGSTWTDWHKEKVKEVSCANGDVLYIYGQYVPVGGQLIPLRKLVMNNPGSKQFNDVLESSCYDPVYAYRKSQHSWFIDVYGESDADNTRFHIGGSVKCLRCGQHELELTETMQCIACEEEYGIMDDDNFGYCSCCNRHIYLERATWVGDEPICDDCLKTETSACERCGELVFNDSLTFHRPSEKYLCRYCLRQTEEDSNWKTVRYPFNQTISTTDGEGVYF